jgi:mRNA-degrading endonuclease RelE of RelBE toxin-antitoxin system
MKWVLSLPAEAMPREKFVVKKLARALRVLAEAENPLHHHTVNRADETDGQWYLRIDRRWRAVLEVDVARRQIVVREVMHRKRAYK